MRVAIIAEVYLPKIDGVVIRTLNLISELQANGDDVMVFCAENGEFDSPVPCEKFRAFSFPMYPEYKIGLPNRRLPDAVRKFDPDVIHFLNPFAFGFRCYDVLQKAGINKPTVFSFHTLYGEFVKRYEGLKSFSRMLWWLTQKYHNQADLNLTVSSIMRDDLDARGFERVRLWQPAVNADLFKPEQADSEIRARLLGEHSDKRLLLTVSRLAPEKNVEFLADVLKQVPDACLAVVGDGPHRSSLEKTFADLPTNFVGYLKGEQLAQAYASADAFVYASETETMGNVVLEAMAAGLPVIAPRAGGIPSLVEDTKSGLLFEPGDTDTAASFVNRVLSERELQASLATASREFAESHDWRNAAMRVRGDYEEAIAAHSENKRQMPRTSVLPRATTRALVFGFRAASSLTRSRVKSTT